MEEKITLINTTKRVRPVKDEILRAILELQEKINEMIVVLNDLTTPDGDFDEDDEDDEDDGKRVVVRPSQVTIINDRSSKKKSITK